MLRASASPLLARHSCGSRNPVPLRSMLCRRWILAWPALGCLKTSREYDGKNQGFPEGQFKIFPLTHGRGCFASSQETRRFRSPAGARVTSLCWPTPPQERWRTAKLARRAEGRMPGVKRGNPEKWPGSIRRNYKQAVSRTWDQLLPTRSSKLPHRAVSGNGGLSFRLPVERTARDFGQVPGGKAVGVMKSRDRALLFHFL